MKLTASSLIRWAGLAAVMAGVFYVVVGIFHQLNILSSVTTTQWAIVHTLAIAMSLFGLFGLTGIYARQVEEAGWLGLAGYLLFSLWLVLMTGFTFAETLILPLLATETPTFVEAFLGIFTSSASEMNLGSLPTLWTITGPLYILGGLLFGLATLRAGILPRWGAGLLVVGSVLAPVAALFPPEHEPKVAVPVGLALAWLGYALWSERPEKASEPVPGRGVPQLHQTGAD